MEMKQDSWHSDFISIIIYPINVTDDNIQYTNRTNGCMATALPWVLTTSWSRINTTIFS